MFGRYFGARYFGPRFWGRGGSGAPPAAAVDILSAIQALYAGTGSAAALPLFGVRADDDATMPYAVVTEGQTREERRDSDYVVYSVVLMLKSYAATLDAVGTLGDAAWAALKGRNPAFAGALCSPLIAPSDPREAVEKNRAKGTPEAFTQTREMRCRVIKAV